MHINVHTLYKLKHIYYTIKRKKNSYRCYMKIYKYWFSDFIFYFLLYAYFAMFFSLLFKSVSPIMKNLEIDTNRKLTKSAKIAH